MAPKKSVMNKKDVGTLFYGCKSSCFAGINRKGYLFYLLTAWVAVLNLYTIERNILSIVFFTQEGIYVVVKFIKGHKNLLVKKSLRQAQRPRLVICCSLL